MQADTCAVDLTARAQIRERAIGIERPHRDLVQLLRPAVVALARKALRVPARAEAVDHQRGVTLGGSVMVMSCAMSQGDG